MFASREHKKRPMRVCDLTTVISLTHYRADRTCPPCLLFPLPRGGTPTSHPPVNPLPLPRLPCTRCLPACLRQRSRAGVLQYCQSWRRIYSPTGFLVSLLPGVTDSLGMDASSSSSKSPDRGDGRTYFSSTWLRFVAGSFFFLMTSLSPLFLCLCVCLSTARKPRAQPGCTQRAARRWSPATGKLQVRCPRPDASQVCRLSRFNVFAAPCVSFLWGRLPPSERVDTLPAESGG